MIIIRPSSLSLTFFATVFLFLLSAAVIVSGSSNSYEEEDRRNVLERSSVAVDHLFRFTEWKDTDQHNSQKARLNLVRLSLEREGIYNTESVLALRILDKFNNRAGGVADGPAHYNIINDLYDHLFPHRHDEKYGLDPRKFDSSSAANTGTLRYLNQDEVLTKNMNDIDDLYDAVFEPKTIIAHSRNRFTYTQCVYGFRITCILNIVQKVVLRRFYGSNLIVSSLSRLLNIFILSSLLPGIEKFFFNEELQISADFGISFKRIASSDKYCTPMVFKYVFIFHWILYLANMIPIEYESVRNNYITILPEYQYYHVIYFISAMLCILSTFYKKYEHQFRISP